MRWRAKWTLERTEEGPPALYHFRDEAEGILSAESGKQRKLTEADFLLENGRIKMLGSLFTIWNEKGEMIRKMEKVYDYKSGMVQTSNYFPSSGEKTYRDFAMTPGMVDAKQIGVFLRGFPFRQGSELEFTLLTDKQGVSPLLVTYVAVEEVETPAGTFSCYKVRLLPDLGIFTFLGRIYCPYIYMWFTVEPPHFWVKYAGLEGDRLPIIVLELLEYHASSGEREGK